VHLPGDRELAIIMAHGFTLSWSRHYVWRVATWLNRSAGVVSFDFRGHGRSGGLSTMGDREIRDLDVAGAPARGPGYRRGGAAGGRGRLLDGRLGRGPVRGPGGRPRRGGLGQRARALVLPRHPAHAPGALGGGAAGGPADHPDLAEDPGEPPWLEPGAGLAGR